MADRILELTSSTRCALWWTGTPALDDQPTGAVGAIEASDADSLTRLLEAACAELAAVGCRHALGPLDGSTWRQYRLISADPDGGPPFPGEPATPAWWPSAFAAAGFEPIARYRSWSLELATAPSLADARIGARLAERALTLRELDLARWDEELDRIFAFAADAFADARFQTPITQTEFAAALAPWRERLDPRLVLLAEAPAGELAGLLFAYPEGPPAPGQLRPAVVLKTLAVAEEHRRSGLAMVLVDRIHRRARELGYRRAIHALQRDDNPVTRLSERCGGLVMRHYELLGRPLRELPRDEPASQFKTGHPISGTPPCP